MFFVWIGLVSLFAGFLGSLTGLGGGMVIVPALTLLFGVDIKYAMGASLISVIATSSGAASAYLKEGFSNIRIGILLEVATTLGALLGAYLTGFLSTHVIAIIFGFVLIYSAYLSIKPKAKEHIESSSDPLALKLKLESTYPQDGKMVTYGVKNVKTAFSLMGLAGTLSGLLGIGSGAVKVLAMDNAMKLPFKVSTTTSNFMIGVTAAASAGVYLSRGYLDPLLAMPVVLGVLSGSLLGSRMLMIAHPKVLRAIFGVVILFLALEMLYNGFSGNI